MDAIKSKLKNLTSPKKKDTILVTGASGFVAAHILNSLLSAGYSVRGTVRNEKSAANVRSTHGQYGDLLTFAIVPDIIAPGAFDEVVKGVDGVIHTASPFVLSVADNERDLLTPAIKGTTNILEAIAKNAPGVKRVVLTSSFASIIDLSKGLRPGYTYTEADWNPVTYEEAKTTPDGSAAYCASKLLAEKAAWDFVTKEKPSFNLATICPPMVYGPTAHHLTSLKTLNTSSQDIYRLIDGSEKTVPETQFYAFSDVRDIAEAHRLAYEIPNAGGERFFVTGGNYSYQMVCDIVREKVPAVKEKTPVGKPGSGLGKDVYGVDGSKAERVLGLKYTSLEKCIVDQVEGFVETGRRLEGLYGVGTGYA
jgi:nucleoside-diphosphate-sugar epimerase